MPATDPAWASFVALVASAPVTGFIKDSDGRYVYINAHLLTTAAAQLGDDWFGKTDADIWPPDIAELLRANDRATLRSGGWQLFLQELPIDRAPHAFLVMKFSLATADGQRYLAGIGVDQTAQQHLAAQRDLLASAVEQTAESVMIADIDARITYVNPAFERISGYSRDEVLGENPRILNSGVQPATYYQAMWAALTSGVPWVADLVNRRKDGTLYTEEAVISPIRDAAGTLTSYVAVKRDVTQERALEKRSAQLTRERALIAATLRELTERSSTEDTAQAICRQVLSLSGVASAQLFSFDVDGRATTIGFAVADVPDPVHLRLPADRSEYLRGRAAQGPWIETWSARPGDPNFEYLSDLGLHSVACAPVKSAGELIGLLVVDGVRTADQAEFTEALPALVEFADMASALIGRELGDRTEASRRQERIRTIITRRAFRPVFQPIVDMNRDTVVGYEALTRFADGGSPELRFAEATSVGLGLQLEVASLKAALAAASALPPRAWLSINVSPDLIVEHRPLRALTRGKRRVVFEVTEHAVIPDYPAFRTAVAELGPKAMLAVDDAGAGFSSLRHILELRPAFVKLDRTLIADVEADEARQAMIVGLRHFADSVGCELIAEGIETKREAEMLRELDVTLGQGYFLGRPIPAEET